MAKLTNLLYLFIVWKEVRGLFMVNKTFIEQNSFLK